MNKRTLFLILLSSLFFLSNIVLARNSNDVPTPTVVTPPPKTPPTPTAPPPATPSPEEPRIRITIPDFPETREKTPYAPTGASVIVRVYESGTNKPISGATVKWYGVNHTTGAISDFRGEANMKWVPLGEAKIRCSAAGHDYNSKIVWVEGRRGTEYFDIYLNKTTKTTPSVETPPTPTVTPKKPEAEGKATVSGTVYDKATRQPISGAAVKAYNASYRQDLIKDVKTDQSGRYAIDNCPLDAAIKILYGKSGYAQQEIPRYIPKVATVYTQDVYLEKGKVETKKPKEDKGSGEKRGDTATTQRALEEGEYINLGIVSAKVGGIELSPDEFIELPAGQWPIYVRYRNRGPSDALNVPVYCGIIDTTDFSREEWFMDWPAILPKGEYRECEETRDFHPGFYSFDVEIYTRGDQTEVDQSDNRRSGMVYFRESEYNADVDIELLEFSIDRQPISSDPTLGIGNGEHEIYIRIANRGPERATGATHVKVTKNREEVIYDEDLLVRDVGEGAAAGIPHPFTPGTYYLECEVTPYALDRDVNVDEMAELGRSRGHVTFTGTLFTLVELPTIPLLRNLKFSDLEISSFTVDGAALGLNPVTLQRGTGNHVLAGTVTNNGPAALLDNGAVTLKLFKNGQQIDTQTLYVKEPGSSAPFERTELFDTSSQSYTVEATVESASGNIDGDTSNNKYTGTIEFIEGAVPGPAQSTQTDLEMVDFTIDGQSVTTNPTITLVPNTPNSFVMSMRNNGTQVGTGFASAYLHSNGAAFRSGQVDVRGVGQIETRTTPIFNIRPGTYELQASIVAPFGDFDPDVTNNVVSGSVTFVAEGAVTGQPPQQPPAPPQPPQQQPPAQPPQVPVQFGVGWPGGAGPQTGLMPPTVAPPPPPAVTEEAAPQAMAGLPVEHPQMGPGPEFVKELSGQAPAKEVPEVTGAKKEERRGIAWLSKRNIFWLLLLLLAGLYLIYRIVKRSGRGRSSK